MLDKMSWTDAFVSLIIPDSMYYKLPTNIHKDDAPSHLVVDGFGTLALTRMRPSVHTRQMMVLRHPDDENRTPLRATVLPQRGQAQGSIHASLPQMAAGSGKSDADKNLYTLGQLLSFGAASVLGVLGGGAPLAGTLIGLSFLVVGCILSAFIVVHSAYHVVNGNVKDLESVPSLPGVNNPD